MNLPKFLGNRIRVGRESKELPAEVTRFMDSEGWQHDCEVYGHTFVKSISIPANLEVHRAFSLDNRHTLLAPHSVRIITDKDIIIRVQCGGTILSEHALLTGETTIEFASLYIQPNYNFWFDISNENQEEVQVQCQLVCHVYCRPGDMIWRDNFQAAHIETPEEIATRLERERIAHEQRVASEQKAWAELELAIGKDSTEFLKENHDGWYSFTGSNNQRYAVSGRGDLANLDKGRKYCVQLVGVPYDLPIPDIIMEKINWCLLRADEIEEKSNDIGAFNSDKIYELASIS